MTQRGGHQLARELVVLTDVFVKARFGVAHGHAAVGNELDEVLRLLLKREVLAVLRGVDEMHAAQRVVGGDLGEHRDHRGDADAFGDHHDGRFAVVKNEAAGGFGNLDLVADVQELGDLGGKGAAVVVEHLDGDAVAAFVGRAAERVGARLKTLEAKRHALAGAEGGKRLLVGGHQREGGRVDAFVLAVHHLELAPALPFDEGRGLDFINVGFLLFEKSEHDASPF